MQCFSVNACVYVCIRYMYSHVFEKWMYEYLFVSFL